MTPGDWVGVASGAALAAGVSAAAWTGLRGGGVRRAQRCRIMCPMFHQGVDCRIVQDIRTGQWKRVEACSAFVDPEAVSCDQECARLMNLGVFQPQALRS
jgi:hypothetical protein